jgi:hypothetical protein
VYDAATGALKRAVKTTEDGLTGLRNLLVEEGEDLEEDVEDATDAIFTRVTMTRTDLENPVHVAALVNIAAAKQAELKELWQNEQLTGDPDDATRIQKELTEVSRIRSVLETHMATLAAEKSGEKEMENISSDVHAARAKTEEMVGISVYDRFSRASETRKIRKRAKTMSRDDATKAFLQAVSDAQAAQDNGQVGTQFINRANIYYERLMQVSGHGQDSVKAAAVTLQRLKATEKARYKGKQQRKKQQSGQVDVEEEDRLASGK